MCSRAYPGSGAWVCLAMLVVIDAAAMAAGGFRLLWAASAPMLAAGGAVWALGLFYSAVRPDARIATLAFGAAYLIPFTFAAALLSYVGTSASMPLLDAHFAAADAALGFDWLAVLAFAHEHPAIGTALRLAYHSSMLQIVAVLIVLAASSQHERLSGFLILFSATGLVTVVISILCPAAGAFVLHNPPQAMRDVVGHAAGIWHLEHFQALRSGAMRTIDPTAIEGLITFPSFHTALAVSITWALWRTRYLAWPTAALNAVVIASTMPVGGHYLVDVLAGAAIAAACIALLHWRSWSWNFGLLAALGSRSWGTLGRGVPVG